MPLEPQPVDRSDCPLLARYGGADVDALFARYEAAAAEYHAVAADRQLAAAAAAGRFDDARRLLARARELMTRRRCAVGCVGVSQAGKSTTINNVLGEELCKPGSGDACSSQPSRIVRADRRGLDVEFLTRARLDERLQTLCGALGLGTVPPDAELERLLARPDFRPADGPEPPRFREDVAYLRQLLAAARSHPDRLADPPRVLADLPFADRYRYTTHTAPGGLGSEALLIREARFRVDTPALPPDLELCDLPGLDSRRTADDAVTWEYLRHLDGTFLFVNVGGNLLSESMLRVFDHLGRAFGALGGRAWVIFNKMDALTRDHFRQGGQDNVFVTIRTVLDRVGVDPAHAVFACKKVFDAAAGGAPPAVAASILGQPADAPVPATCPPELRPAWDDLLHDGGVARLKRLMLREVAETLAGQIRAEAGRALDEFSAALAARAAAERKRLKMDRAALQAAVICHSTVLGLRAALAARPHDFPVLFQEGEVLRGALARLFEPAAATELLPHLSAGELVRQFRTHARLLTDTLDAELSGDLIGRVYQAVGDRLAALPEVQAGPAQQSCQEAWRRYAREDRDDPGWRRAGLPGFASDDLAGWLADPTGDGTGPGAYVPLMREKIDAVVRRAVHLLRTRLRSRLGELAGELELLTGGEAAA